MVARRAHNPKVGGSSPPLATKFLQNPYLAGTSQDSGNKNGNKLTGLCSQIFLKNEQNLRFLLRVKNGVCGSTFIIVISENGYLLDVKVALIIPGFLNENV